MRVLLLEDDIIFSEIIEEYLNHLKYSVETVFDLYTAEELLYTNRYDLLILDVNVPGGNGLDLLERFRNNGYKTPTIIITSFTNIDSIERAYKIGCDDYIKKPFELKELQVRINYLEHTHKINFKGQIKIDNETIFDSYNMNIRKNNTVIKIPKKEADIIKFFLLNENRIITVDELIRNVWEYNEQPSIATIRTYIKNIRKTLKNDFLETIKNVGYKYSTTS
jgi:DNA-binding response OmpR family regulator